MYDLLLKHLIVFWRDDHNYILCVVSIMYRNWGDPTINGNIKRGGGVCLYIHEKVIWSDPKYKHLNRSESFVESQWIEVINPKCKNFIIANIYRPPSGAIERI